MTGLKAVAMPGAKTKPVIGLQVGDLQGGAFCCVLKSLKQLFLLFL